MRERGSVFVLTLAVLVAMVGLIATLAATNRAFARAQWNRMEDRRARLMVESGIQRAVAELQSLDATHAASSDKWATLGSQGDDAFKLGSDCFRLQIIDASGRIDINKAAADQLRKAGLTAEQSDSLLDWREQGLTARAEGAKDSFYRRLANPYATKQKPFESVDELLMVRGFSPDALLRSRDGDPALDAILAVDTRSADPDVAGKQKLNLNSATQDQLAKIGVPKDLTGSLVNRNFSQMKDALSIDGMTTATARTLADNTAIGDDAERSGLINVNTASAFVLRTVPDLDDGAAQDIVSHQRTGFRSLGDLLDLPGMDVGKFAKVVDRFCVGSRTFIVRVIGIAGDRKVAAEAALVLDSNGEVKIKRIQPVLYPYARDGWGWLEKPSRTVEVAR